MQRFLAFKFPYVSHCSIAYSFLNCSVSLGQGKSIFPFPSSKVEADILSMQGQFQPLQSPHHYFYSDRHSQHFSLSLMLCYSLPKCVACQSGVVNRPCPIYSHSVPKKDIRNLLQLYICFPLFASLQQVGRLSDCCTQ